jgi:hypothetical protein
MGTLFWGTLLILIGLQLLVSAIFGIDLPILRLAFGVWIVYLGISLLYGIMPWRTYLYHWSTNSTHKTHTKDSSSYSVVFGTQHLNFADLDFTVQTEKATNTVFGTTYVTLDPTIPTLINASATFGTVIFPDNSQVASGSESYNNYSNSDVPVLILNVNAVFGTVIIRYI